MVDKRQPHPQPPLLSKARGDGEWECHPESRLHRDEGSRLCH